jgi:F-type H+-transporting ATPase subunit b
MKPTVLAAGNNFLVPNWTFFAELVAFVIILWLIGRYIAPPVQRAMRERQEMIKKQVEDSEKAASQLEQAQQQYRELLAQARTEAAKIRDGARADAQRLSEEMREQANEEVARIQRRGEESLAQQRDQVVRELRSDVGELAVHLASRVVGESLEDEARRSGVIDRSLDELDQLRTPGTQSPSQGSGQQAGGSG